MNSILIAATIQFVGLCMVRENATNTGVEIVLPRVEQSSIGAMAHGARGTDFGSHTAILAYRKTSFVSKSAAWQTQELKPAPTYDYVVLTHDRLQIAIGPQKEPSRVPRELPSMTNGCAKSELASDYQRPYPRAAAVLELTGGKLTACRPKINGREGLRIDTTLTFEHPANADLEIIATDGGTSKKLVVKTNDALIIGNVPTSWLNSAPTTTGDSELAVEGAHYRAFYTMLASADRCSQAMVSVGVCDSPDIGFRFGGVRGASGKVGTKRTNSMAREAVVMQMETYSCSNSQYP